MNVIDRFYGNEYEFLSNFTSVTGGVEMDGIIYRTVEHAYQASKTLFQSEREFIRTIEVTILSPRYEKVKRDTTAAEAKRRGRKVTLRKDWDQVKIAIMRNLVKKKFEVPELREQLLATGDAMLIESNYWHDTFWGVCNGEGQNHLGLILMDVRQEFIDEMSEIPPEVDDKEY